MAKTSRQYMTEFLIKFGRLFQLPEPTAEYIDAIQTALHAYGWKLSDFRRALEMLLHDDTYAETAKFGKYPTIHDFLRLHQQNKSKPFYTALSAYLSGAWWEKENVLALANTSQANALMLAGGLSNLYARATGEKATPVYKLIDIVVNNEAESPAEIIDTSNRIGMATDLKTGLKMLDK